MNAPANTQSNTIMFLPGRIVQGDLYEPNTTDMQGNPLKVQSGQNAGQPRVEYFFKVAIPKTQAQWWLEPYGQQVFAIAAAAWPQGQTSNPKFAWKIEDGDDATPNFERGGRKNCETEGFAGCWVIKFSSGFATKVIDSQGNPMLQPGLVKRGFWVEVLGTVNSNENAQKPGIFINHNAVAFRAPDKEITSGPDLRTVGFGRAPLPPGVTAAPVGAAAFPAPATPAPAGVPAMSGPQNAPAVPVRTPAPATPAATPSATPVAVQPHAGFIAPGGVPATPGGVPAAPGAVPAIPAIPVAPAVADPLGAPAGFRMANPAGGRYEAFTAAGWTNEAMIAAGHMVRL